eukprot:10986904-Ditylum_brightwellii.AAC.1
MDVHFQIEAYLHQLTHTLQTHHIKGHQTGSNLAWETMLNNRVDALATNALDQLTTQHKKGTTTLYPACKAHVLVQGQAITRNCNRELQHAYTLINFRKHLEEKFKWSRSVWATIDWSPHGTLLLRQTFYRQKLLVKVIHEQFSGLGEPYNPLPMTQCPCCHTATKTMGHFLHCHHNIEL